MGKHASWSSAAVGRWVTAAALHIYLWTWCPQNNTSAKTFALVGDMCMLLVMRICDSLCDAQAPQNLVVQTPKSSF